MPETLIRPVVRENLIREAPFECRDGESDGTGDGFTIQGHGAVFNTKTEINSWEGGFQEEIHPGAFKRTLRAQTPMMQYDHGHHPLIGSIPLGVWSRAEEDELGVFVEGRITDNWLMQPVRDAISNKGIKGMSFRFSVVREVWVDQAGTRVKDADVEMALWAPDRLGYELTLPLVRQLKEVKAPEIGPVAWPQYTETDVGVRSLPGLDVADGRRVVIDLARLDSPNERATLARAIFLADNAVRQQLNGPQADSEQTPDPHVDDTDEDLRQEATAAETTPEGHQTSDPGEHPSPSPVVSSRKSKMRLHTNAYRSYVLSLEGTEDGERTP